MDVFTGSVSSEADKGQKCLSLNYAFCEKAVSQLAYMGKRPDQQHKNLID